MCAIPSGSTYRRVRFSWGFAGTTPAITDMGNMAYNLLTMGLVTTIGDGTETPPNPVTASGDASPPTERWVWWESRQPVVCGLDELAGVAAWRDSGPQEAVDVKTQVLATGIPGGDTLNLWASWAADNDWDTEGAVTVWVSTSVLFSTP